MKRLCRALALTLAMLLTLAPLEAFAVLELLPTPKPSQETAGTICPNFGNICGEQGELAAEDFSYDHKTWSVWYYPLTSNWSNNVNDWVEACKNADFSMQLTTYDNHVAYQVEKDGYQAVLVPNVYDRVLVLVQQGLSIAEAEDLQQTALGLGDVRITYNGRVYTANVGTHSWLNEYGHYYSCSASLIHEDLGYFDLHVPMKVSTGTTAHYASKDNITDAVWFLALKKGGNVLFNGAAFAPRHQMKTNRDYFDAVIYYRDEYEVQGKVNASFNNGADVVEFEFHLGLK